MTVIVLMAQDKIEGSINLRDADRKRQYILKIQLTLAV